MLVLGLSCVLLLPEVDRSIAIVSFHIGRMMRMGWMIVDVFRSRVIAYINLACVYTMHGRRVGAWEKRWRTAQVRINTTPG
jgi:hypothetical protein